MAPTDSDALARATEHYLAAHPEEASTLGLRAGADRWAERSFDALTARAREHRAHLARLEDHGGDAADDLDRAMLAAHLRAEARRIERGDVLASLEGGVLPPVVLRFQAFQARSEAEWDAVAARAAAMPEALAQQRALLERGLREGRPADAAIAAALAEHELPAMAADLAALGGWPAALGHAPPRCAPALRESGARAAEAARAHARFLTVSVVPRGASAYATGEPEYAARLRDELGLDASPGELFARYEARLPALDEQLVEAARAVAPGTIEGVADARALVSRLWGEALGEHEDPLAVYRDAIERSAAFAVERGLYRLPSTYALAIRPLPAHRRGELASTNWPAPPLDRSRPGLLLVSPRPADHARADVELLAVHEAAPGHYVQSAAFQSRFAGSGRVPARLLGMTDEIAMATGFFGPMLAIEGFAVRAEEVMDAAGFFGPETHLLEVASAIIRALRVVTDVGLHTGAMDRDEAARLLADRTGLPRTWGRAQALRYSRVPLQAITYALGAEEFARHEQRARQRAGTAPFVLADYHDAVLAEGPVPPAWLAT